MNKKFIPSLVIAAKGIMITAIGLLFHFLHKPGAYVLLYVGGGLILVSLIVLVIMYSVKSKP